MAYRVYQWASGSVGRYAASTVLERSDMELVGLHVLSPEKAGRDAGELLGTGRLGFAASADPAVVRASEADVVIHSPLPSLVYGASPDKDLDDICELLAVGKNVITVVGYMYPKVYGAAVVNRLEEACAAGDATFHSTGLNPGWLGDLMPLNMSALAQRIDCVIVREISNFQGYPSPEIMFESMGFGLEPAAFERHNERQRRWLNGLFGESIQMVADGLALALDEMTQNMSVETAPHDLETAAGVVRAGTVAGQRWEWVGIAASKQRIVHETVWRMHEAVAPRWPTGKHSVRLEGAPTMHVEFDADWIADGLLGTAMHAVNAAPAVCAAEPGIKTFLDLPWIMGRGTAS